MHHKILKRIGEHLDKLERDPNSRAVYDDAEQGLRRVLGKLTDWDIRRHKIYR